MARLQLKTKDQMRRHDIPILSYTRDMLKTEGSEGMLGKSYFEADLEPEREYIVLDLREYSRMSPENQEKMWQLCDDMDIQGDESHAKLESILEAYDTSSVSDAVGWVQEAFAKEPSPEEEAFLQERIRRADAELEESGYSEALDGLLHDPGVCVMLESEHHQGFDELPLIDQEELGQIAHLRMPVYIVVDVSKSMLDEDRYLFAREIVMKIRQHLLTQKLTDDVRVIIYSDAAVEIELRHDEVIRPRASTATGAALDYVAGLIEERHPDQPVYIALVTDGEPTTGGEYEQELCEPQEFAEIKASHLPEKAKLVQFALAPIDPDDTGQFERYLRNINSITEKSPYGQTIVLLRKREDNLAYLVLGGHQKIKQTEGWELLYGASE